PKVWREKAWRSRLTSTGPYRRGEVGPKTTGLLPVRGDLAGRLPPQVTTGSSAKCGIRLSASRDRPVHTSPTSRPDVADSSHDLGRRNGPRSTTEPLRRAVKSVGAAGGGEGWAARDPKSPAHCRRRPQARRRFAGIDAAAMYLATIG